MNLSGQVGIITGGSRGLGRPLPRACSGEIIETQSTF